MNKYLHLGFTLGATVLLFSYGGDWVDKKLGTSPLFLLIGLSWAMFGTLYYIIKELNKSENKDK